MDTNRPDINREQLIKDILSPMQEALKNVGITHEMLAKKLLEDLGAKETKFFSFKGEVTDQRDVISWDVRQRAEHMAHQIMGNFAPEKKDISINDEREFDPVEEEILAKATEEIAKRRIEQIRKQNSPQNVNEGIISNIEIPKNEEDKD